MLSDMRGSNMDWVLGLWAVVTTLSILGALSLADMAGEFHKRGIERVRQAQRVWRECGECGWGDFDPGYFEEIAGENFCSLHR